jgi:hypothetical protein
MPILTTDKLEERNKGQVKENWMLLNTSSNGFLSKRFFKEIDLIFKFLLLQFLSPLLQAPAPISPPYLS